jgi:hypothetical protein
MSDTPKPGQTYFPGFESDYFPGAQLLQIESVGESYEDGGYDITADDGIAYDCYWSSKLEMWVYHNS